MQGNGSVCSYLRRSVNVANDAPCQANPGHVRRLLGQHHPQLTSCWQKLAEQKTIWRQPCAADQPSSPVLPNNRCQALTRTERRRLRKARGRRQKPQDYCKQWPLARLVWLEGFQVRKAWDGMRAPWDGMRHCRPAVVGLCCTQETTSGAVLVPQYTDCSEKPTVKALASNPCSFTSARTSRLPIVGDTQTICNGSAESRGLAWAPRIASGHVA